MKLYKRNIIVLAHSKSRFKFWAKNKLVFPYFDHIRIIMNSKKKGEKVFETFARFLILWIWQKFCKIIIWNLEIRRTIKILAEHWCANKLEAIQIIRATLGGSTRCYVNFFPFKTPSYKLLRVSRKIILETAKLDL